jgi:hypothetical protein
MDVDARAKAMKARLDAMQQERDKKKAQSKAAKVAAGAVADASTIVATKVQCHYERIGE